MSVAAREVDSSTAHSASAALAGAAIRYPARAADVVAAWRTADLAPRDMSERLHADVVKTVSALVDAGDAVTKQTIAAKLGKRKLPGGVSSLTELAQQGAMPEAIAAHAEILKAHTRHRRQRLAATRIGELAASDAPVEDIRPLARVLVDEPVETGMVLLADVERQAVSWLWEGRLALGKLTVLDGLPGQGKSTLTIAIAAAVTAGRDIVTGRPGNEPAGVVFLACEDGAADTMRPRADAHGADCKRIALLQTVRDSDGAPRPIELPEDLDTLDRAVDAVGARLVVLDPLVAFLGAGVDEFKDKQVRKALLPICSWAERKGVALLALRHLRKAAGGPAMYAGGGSVGIIGAARVGLMLAPDPDDDSIRVLATTKCNIAKHAPSLRLRLVDTHHGVARLEWIEGACSLTADSLLATRDASPAVNEACDFLRELLMAGPVLATTVKSQARDAGVSADSLYAAQKRLEVRSTKQKGPAGKWVWSLPDHPAFPPVSPSYIKGGKEGGWRGGSEGTDDDDEVFGGGS